MDAGIHERWRNASHESGDIVFVKVHLGETLPRRRDETRALPGHFMRSNVLGFAR
jgi:hypothetical protein